MDRDSIRTELVRLAPADALDEVCAMQEEAFASLPDPSLLRRNDRDTLRRAMLDPHRTLGIYVIYPEIYSIANPDINSGRQLAAFGILWRGGRTDENLGAAMGFAGAALDRVYNVKLIIVRPCFRGRGFQSLLLGELERIALAEPPGCDMLCATAAPGNIHSLRNFLRAGYRVFGNVKKYGGLDRVLLYKELY